MNIVFDDGLRLDDEYREALAPLLPIGNAPLRLDSSTAKTDGTPSSDEGFVFITNLPVDVLKYHSLFFENHKDAPQWFFVLLNKNDHGITVLRNAARKHDLKNPVLLHARNVESFAVAINDIVNTKQITKGKALLFSKHKRAWTTDLARILFDDDNKYEIMDSVNLVDTDSETLLLCGEKITDFKGFELPGSMEPYFVFRFKGELQHYINPSELISEIAEYHHMTTERVESRLYFIDIESELWLSDANKPTGDDAVADGILIWDCFGLPVSRAEYTEANIKTVAFRCHENMEKLMELI